MPTPIAPTAESTGFHRQLAVVTAFLQRLPLPLLQLLFRLWGSILLFLLTRGAGTVSLDWLFGLEPTSPRKE